MADNRSPHYKLTNILADMADDGELADTVLAYLNDGMLVEWDCNLISETASAFGPDEFRIAAKSAYEMAKEHG